MQLNERIKAKS